MSSPCLQCTKPKWQKTPNTKISLTTSIYTVVVFCVSLKRSFAVIRHALPKASPCLTVVSFTLLPEQTTSRGPRYNRPHTVAVFSLALCCEAWLRCGPLLLGQHGHEDGGIAGQRRHRCPSFAPYITWVCGAATAVEYKWRSGSGVLDRSDPGQWTFCRVTFLSCRARPRPSPPRHQLTCPPSHLPSAQGSFFSLPAGAVSASSFCRLVGHGCASCTCGRWVLRSRGRKGRWQSLSCA